MTKEEQKMFQKSDWYQVDMDRLGKEPHQYDGKSIPYIECYVERMPLDEDYLTLNHIDYDRMLTLNEETELGFKYTKHLWDKNKNYRGYEDRTIRIYLPNVHGKIHYVDELQHILRDCGLNNIADDFKIK